MGGPPVYRDYDQAGLDAQYNNQRQVPSVREHLKRYRDLTDAAKGKVRCVENLAYGSAPEETLDLYGDAGGTAPVLVFIHGGAWQHLGKDDSGFMAPAFVAAGAMVAALNFGHVPEAGIDTMVSQARRAVAWLWHHVGDYGGDPQRIFLVGHSSGAHLLSQCLTARWQTEFDCPGDVVKGALFASGLGDLEPVRLSYRNALLQLDAQAVARLSLIHQRPTVRCPLIVAFAEADTPEFQRQTRAVGDYWRGHGLPVQLVQATGRHHYDMLFDLADPTAALFQACAHLMRLPARQAADAPAVNPSLQGET